MAQILAQIQNHISRLIAEWNQNDIFNLLNDTDLSENGSFAHLTKSEIANAINAITAITAVDTALGDYVTGQVTNLIKLRG